MKSFLIIGAGKFGHFLCRRLFELGQEIMLLDRSEEAMSDLLPYCVSARIGEATRPEVLQALGIEDYDACVVCMGENFQNSLEITDRLKELGARRVVAVASTDIQAKFLLRNGADQVVFPNRDMAYRLASGISVDNIFDTIEITAKYGVHEIRIPNSWVGKTVASLQVRGRYGLNILGYKLEDGSLDVNVQADTVFTGKHHLMVVGRLEDVQRLEKEA